MDGWIDKMKWDEMRWDEVRWGEMRWDEVRWGEMRWDEMRWDEMRWGEMRWYRLYYITLNTLHYHSIQNSYKIATKSSWLPQERPNLGTLWKVKAVPNPSPVWRIWLAEVSHMWLWTKYCWSVAHRGSDGWPSFWWTLKSGISWLKLV